MDQLSICDYERHRNRNVDRNDGTCRWVLDDPVFLSWQKDGLSTFLFVTGIAGCGKSVLYRSLLEHELRGTEKRSPCFFFFKNDNIEQKSICDALSALLHQLFSQRKDLIKHAISHFDSEGSKLHARFQKLWMILVAAAEDPIAGDTVCVIDAIDECEKAEQATLIEEIVRYHKGRSSRTSTQSKLRFLLTSRPPRPSIHRITHEIPTIICDLAIVSSEIDRVVRQDVLNFVDLDEEERAALLSELLARENRTYLWLKLIMDIVQQEVSPTKKKLAEIINSLPETISQAYEQILSKVENVEPAQKLLSIVVATVRPLTINEVNIALAVEQGHVSQTDLDLENEARLASTLPQICNHFVNVIETRVYLIHQTAKNFLLSRVHKNKWYHLDLRESDLVLARTCINYILLDEFKYGLSIREFDGVNWQPGDDSSTDESSDTEKDLAAVASFDGKIPIIGGRQVKKFRAMIAKKLNGGRVEDRHHPDGFLIDEIANSKEIMAKYKYFNYAASQWPNHFRAAQDLADPATLQLVDALCTPTQRFDNWFNIYWSQPYGSSLNPPPIPSRLMVAVHLGFYVMIPFLLEDGVDPNQQDEFNGQTALALACMKGNKRIVEKFVAFSNIAIKERDKKGHTPLMWAAGNPNGKKERLDDGSEAEPQHEDHGAIAKMLLDTGKALYVADKEAGMTALMIASENGRRSVVEALLKAPDFNAKRRSKFLHQTPLHFAA